MYGNRLYATLSQVNQTIVRVKNRQELFESICKVAVEFGEFRLAWIGLFNSETGHVIPMAECGYNQNKLPFQNINARETPFLQGLIGVALQTEQITFSNDIQTDPNMQHWHETAILGDYHSAVAVPIRQGGRIVGLLNLYAADIGFFLLQEEQNLLTEMGLDISFALDSMQVETERGEVQERFEKVFRNNSTAIALSSMKDGRYLEVNNAFLNLTGYSQQEVIGHTSLDLNLIHLEDRARIIEQLRQFGTFKSGEARIQTKTGEVRYVRISAQEISIGSEKFFLSMNEDITERKQAEEAQRESEERYRVVAETATDGIITIDESSMILFINPSMEKIFGYRRDEMLGNDLTLLIPEYLHSRHKESLKRYVDTHERHIAWEATQLSGLHKNGREIPLEISFGELVKDGKHLFTGIVRDITDRKLAEDALHESEERYRIVSELTSDYAYRYQVEPDGRMVPEWITESFTRITGYTFEETRAPDFWQRLIHPEDASIFLQHTQRILSGQPDTEEMRAITKSGEARWLRDFANPTWNVAEKRVTSLYGAVQDITERKRADEALKTSERRFRALVENSGMLINLINREGVLIYVSPSSANVVGYTPEEMTGHKVVEFLHPDEIHDKERPLPNMFRGPGSVVKSERRVRHKDETWRWVEGYSTNLLDDPAVDALVFNYRDITDRKQAEEQNRFLAELVASVSDAIIAVDLQQNIQSWNTGAEAMYGWKEAEVLGLPAKEILNTDFLETARETVTKQIMEQGYWSGEVLQLHRSGTWLPALSSVSLYKNTEGKPAGIVAVNRDITERKRAEEEIYKLNAELEERV
ncbi:MAG: PAS domain S-box protein, partial [Chloroflexi bacterium]|nr:PAS domain S-box protein [Chloroflexota bacterium]